MVVSVKDVMILLCLQSCLSTIMVAIMNMLSVALKLNSQLPKFYHVLECDNGSERVAGRSDLSKAILDVSKAVKMVRSMKHAEQSKVDILHI